MSALGRFIGKDAAARMVLLAALAAPLGAEAAPLSSPVPAATQTVSSPAALVVMDEGADRLSKVVDALRQGTRRCLVAQGRMLKNLGTQGFDLSEDPAGAAAKAVWNQSTGLRAAEERSTALEKDISGETTLVAAGALLRDGTVTGPERDVLLHHRNLRAACLSWTARSLDMLYANLDGKPGEEMAERLSQIREMAAHDNGRMVALAKGEIPLDSAAIEAMESFGPAR